MTPRRAALAALTAFVFAGTPAFADAPEEEQLWKMLKSGGQVVLMRHAVTTPGIGDPPGMRVDDCATQRNLTDEGRRRARAIGEAVRARGVEFERVMSSPMCRCLETARLAFGRVDDVQPVTNARGGDAEMPRQVREMRSIAADKRRGGNVILVSHATTIANVTGMTLEPGEMLVVTPQGDGHFALRGKLRFPSP